MKEKYLAISYECLSSIGNSFELESMMSEVVITFYQATRALFVGYYADVNSDTPMIAAGKGADIKIEIQNSSCFTFEHEDSHVVILPLKNGYMKFIYDKHSDIKYICKLICNFQRKINFALSACSGVKELEELNDKLEEKIDSAVRKIRKHEEMLLVQSKSAIMGEMLEMIAHQWRQPITSIGMISNNMLFNIMLSENQELDKESFKNELDDINKQIKYLSHTIDDFRSFFKESKFKEEIVLDVILNKSLSLIKKQLEYNSIEIKVNNTCQGMKLYTYKNELTQVLLNLLHNSKDAFDMHDIENKKISIDSFLNEEGIVIELKDNAGGIDETILKKIFEPYFSTKKEKNGTGIGLYMSKTIVETHLEGKISARNEEGGAVFSIIIPLNN